MRTAELKVVQRSEGSKSENKKLRRQGLVPANIYGPGEKNAYCAFDERDLKRAIGNSSSGNLLLVLQSEAKEFNGRRVILKSLERDPVTWASLHADFYSVSLDRPIEVNVPLEFQGTPKGVKLHGGILQIARRSVSVRGLADDIPDSIQVDISELDVNKSMHVSDLKVSEKVKILDSGDYTLATVVEQAKEEIAAPAAAAEGAAAEAATAETAPAAETAEKK